MASLSASKAFCCFPPYEFGPLFPEFIKWGSDFCSIRDEATIKVYHAHKSRDTLGIPWWGKISDALRSLRVHSDTTM